MEQEIVDALKEQYPRDLRKQVVKAIQRDEKGNDKEALKSSYNVIGQIFSYVMSELNWNLSEDTSKWDDTPLKIIKEVFPKIETTKWFTAQQLNVSKSIKLDGDFN